MSVRVRPPAVAGTFYPANPVDLQHEIDRSFLTARATEVDAAPKAIVVPHAGYVYSGPIAASAYRHLSRRKDIITRVVVLGPSHRVAFEGLAVPTVDAFETPLGPVPIDADGRAAVLAIPGVIAWDEPHAFEHSLEVHLPFLQTVLGEFTLIPLAVGRTPAHLVSDVLDAVWGGPETLIVVSSDLSHYHDHQTAEVLDRRTADAVEAGRFDLIGPLDACGAYPLRGLLQAAKRHRLSARTVDLRNSGDTAGPRNQVVGYGAFLFTETTLDESMTDRIGAASLSADDRAALLDLADAAIRRTLWPGSDVADPLIDSPALVEKHGVFVTVTVDGNLNGCIGSLWGDEPLCEAVPRLAVQAAFADPRLPRLTTGDYPGLAIKIAILSRLVPISAESESDLLAQLQVGVDGLLIAAGRRQATFLPAVWATLAEPADFLAQLKLKAGVPVSSWPDPMRAWRYRTIEFSSRPGRPEPPGGRAYDVS
jgi:MEMO1 family protein